MLCRSEILFIKVRRTNTHELRLLWEKTFKLSATHSLKSVKSLRFFTENIMKEHFTIYSQKAGFGGNYLSISTLSGRR